MEMTERTKDQTVSLAILILSLTALASGLGVLTLLTARAAGGTEDVEVRRSVGKLAWLSLALLGLTAVLLFWSVVRLFRSRVGARRSRTKTPYVNAWALAGKRFKLEEHPDQDPEGQDEGESEQTG
jgi:hypothetical protein